jgi:hypothetical protein
MVRAWIETKRAGKELELKVNPPPTRPTQVEVVGGMRSLPGTNIIMPDRNGHQLDAIDSVASESPQFPDPDSNA